MKNEILKIERTYDAAPEKVWQALTDISLMKQWYFPMLEKFEPTKGFETQFDVHHNGNIYTHIWKITEVLPQQKIAYSWRYGGYPGLAIVTFAIEPLDGKTKLTLTHEVFESFNPEQYPDFSLDNFNKGWTHFVGALGKFVEDH